MSRVDVSPGRHTCCSVAQSPRRVRLTFFLPTHALQAFAKLRESNQLQRVLSPDDIPSGSRADVEEVHQAALSSVGAVRSKLAAERHALLQDEIDDSKRRPRYFGDEGESSR